MKAYLILPLLLVLILSSFSTQNESIIHFDKIYKVIELDVLGNPLMANDHSLDKYNSKGELLSHFSDMSYGDVFDIDASDALEILVYYQDFQKLLFLDSDLAPKLDPIDISDLAYPDASLVCSSFNSGFWIWDSQTAQFVRFSNQLQEEQKTGNVHAIIGKQIAPVKIREGNQYLVVLDTAQGLFLFDRFGAYLKNLPFQNVQDFQLTRSEICYLQRDTIKCYNLKTLTESSLPLSGKNIDSFCIKGDQILLKNKANRVSLVSFSKQ